jgi:hypothetical protein
LPTFIPGTSVIRFFSPVFIMNFHLCKKKLSVFSFQLSATTD